MIQQESQNAEISQVESFGMPISQESAEIEKVNKQAKNPQIFVPQTQDTIEETHNNVPVQTLHKQPPVQKNIFFVLFLFFCQDHYEIKLRNKFVKDDWICIFLCL